MTKSINSRIASIVLAIICSAFLISNYVKSIFGITADFGDYLLLLCLLILFVLQINKKLHPSKYVLTMVCLIPFLIGLIALMRNDQNIPLSDGYYKYFFFYVIISYLVTKNEINNELFLRWMMIIIVPIILVGSSFWAETSEARIGGSSIGMGASYSLLPCVIAFILHFSYYRKKTVVYYSLYVLNALCCVRLVLSGTRGCLLGIVLTVYYVIIDKNKHEASFKKVALGYGVLLSMFWIVLSNLQSVLKLIYDFLNEHGLYNNLIFKSYNALLRNSSILNGRDYLWDEAKRIISSESMGTGVGCFENTYGTYPHNIVFQFLLDFGWVIGGLMCFLLLYCFFKGITCSFDNKVLVVMFFFCSIPRLMVSSTYWKDQFFWLFLIYSTYIIWNSRRRKTVEVKNCANSCY